MTLVEMTYIAAGVALPMFYIPQIVRCLRDDAGLVSFSLRKCSVQLVLRLLMLPFIWEIGNDTMTWIVALDLLGRLLELVAALTSLRMQGRSWADIAGRLHALHQHPSPSRPKPTATTPSPVNIAKDAL